MLAVFADSYRAAQRLAVDQLVELPLVSIRRRTCLRLRGRWMIRLLRHY